MHSDYLPSSHSSGICCLEVCGVYFPLTVVCEGSIWMGWMDVGAWVSWWVGVLCVGVRVPCVQGEGAVIVGVTTDRWGVHMLGF